MTFSLTVLGTGSALPAKNRFPTAQALNVHERFFLVDCGEGTQIQLRKSNNIKLARLDHIFISHLHGDHIFGIYGLISTMDLMGRKNDLHIYGPKLIKNVLDDHLKYFGENMSYKTTVHELDAYRNRIIYEDKIMTVETIPLHHRIPTCGYLFREKLPDLNISKEAIEKYNLSIREIAKIKEGNDLILESGERIRNDELTYRPYIPRSYAFCSDTMYTEKITNIIYGADLLYHESTFLDDMKDTAKQTGHSTAKQAAEIASKSHAKKLLLGHFSSRYDDKLLPNFEREARCIFKETYLAEENVTYEIPLIRNKKNITT